MSEPKTVRVRIAVAVDANSNWFSAGGSEPCSDKELFLDALREVDDGAKLYWLTADLPIPTVAEVPAEGEESK
jgi:hypothetical protein